MSGPKPQDISGQKFGKLTAIKRTGRTAGRVSMWLCECDCGNRHETTISRLRNGQTTSCGCKNRVDNPVDKERLFNIWGGMRQRCFNPNATYFKYYGGRGISICEEWNDYKAFREWSYKNGYNDDLTIDRIDNDKDYSPNNCRWITNIEQQSNKSNNIYVKYDGEDITLAELSRRTNINLATLSQRFKRGDREERLFRPVTGYGKLTKQEVVKIKEMLKKNIEKNVIAEEFNVSPSSITHIKQGKSWTNV